MDPLLEMAALLGWFWAFYSQNGLDWFGGQLVFFPYPRTSDVHFFWEHKSPNAADILFLPGFSFLDFACRLFLPALRSLQNHDPPINLPVLRKGQILQLKKMRAWPKPYLAWGSPPFQQPTNSKRILPRA